jgi:hypothetical protein
MVLVLYNYDLDEIKLYDGTDFIWYKETNYVVWTSLEAALKYGWETIGTL